MLPGPYWPFPPLSSATAHAMRQILIQQQQQQQQQQHLPDCKVSEQTQETRPRTSTTGFTASQLASSNFEPQNRIPSIPQPVPSISSNSITAALSAWYGQQASQGHFGQEIGNLRTSPPLAPPSLPSTHSQASHNPGFIKSMFSSSMVQPKEGTGESANHLPMEVTDNISNGVTSSSSLPPTSSSSDPGTLAAMVAAAAAAISGLCRTSGVPTFPGVVDSEPPSAFQMPESQMNGENNGGGGLNLSTSGEVVEHSSNVTSMEDGEEDDIFLRHMDKLGVGASRRRKLHRKREVELRGCVKKSAAFGTRLQHHCTAHHLPHQQQRSSARKSILKSVLGSLG